MKPTEIAWAAGLKQADVLGVLQTLYTHLGARRRARARECIIDLATRSSR